MIGRIIDINGKQLKRGPDILHGYVPVQNFINTFA